MIYTTPVLCTLLASLGLTSGKIYFKEDFNTKDWEKRWVVPSDWKPSSELGKWDWTAGKWYGDESDKGIKTSQDARFYGLSSKLEEPFTNKDKELVLQFSVKHEQKIDCGGAYIKLLGEMDPTKFGGDTPYQIMFGPDICGMTKRTHVIFNYPPKNDNLLIKEDVRTETDQVTHLFTLVVKPDNTFDVLIDMKSVESGSLEENFDFLLPKEIKDPKESKPVDWVDAKKIADPEDKKPAGYDDIPAEIPDSDAVKPDDWDTEEDGEYEAPMIPNPEFKGPWKPKMIDNPAYKGEWVHPLIPNPDYKEDKELYLRANEVKHIGFELWQVASGTVFDDILVTDSLDEAKAYAEETFFKKKDAEKKMFDEYEAAVKAQQKENEAKNPPADVDEDDEDDEDDRDEL